MREVMITVVGNIAGDVTTDKTNNGYQYTSFTVAQSDRRFDRAANQWVNESPSYYRVTCWRNLAANAVASFEKGQPVIVTGRQKVRSWRIDETNWGGETEIEAFTVGHDLNWGISTFAKPVKQSFDAKNESEEAFRRRVNLAEEQAAASGEQAAQAGNGNADHGDPSVAGSPAPAQAEPAATDAWPGAVQHQAAAGEQPAVAGAGEGSNANGSQHPPAADGATSAQRRDEAAASSSKESGGAASGKEGEAPARTGLRARARAKVAA
jgi:single-strand DNA-binding protein